jgi:hypothetical protein
MSVVSKKRTGNSVIGGTRASTTSVVGRAGSLKVASSHWSTNTARLHCLRQFVAAKTPAAERRLGGDIGRSIWGHLVTSEAGSRLDVLGHSSYWSTNTCASPRRVGQTTATEPAGQRLAGDETPVLDDQYSREGRALTQITERGLFAHSSRPRAESVIAAKVCRDERRGRGQAIRRLVVTLPARHCATRRTAEIWRASDVLRVQLWPQPR